MIDPNKVRKAGDAAERAIDALLSGEMTPGMGLAIGMNAHAMLRAQGLALKDAITGPASVSIPANRLAA